MPVDKLSIEQFAQRIKQKYPQYKDVNDSELVDRMVQKYPEYKERINYQPIQKQSQPQQSAPEFKPMTNWLDIPKEGYQPMVEANAIPIDERTKSIGQAATRVSNELGDIDPHIGNLIYDRKKDMEGKIKNVQLGFNPKEEGPVNFQAQQLDKQFEKPIDVQPHEIERYKNEMATNPAMAREALQQKVKDLLNTDPARASQIKADIYRLDAQERSDKEDKVLKNVAKLKSGDFDYDIKRGVLTQPQGFFGSLATGFKQKNQLFKDYEFYTKTENEAAIIKELNSKMKDYDPDEATKVPDGALGEAGSILGGTPIKPLVGGAVASYFTTPLGGAAAAGGITSHEMYKLGYAGALPQNYASIKKEHPDMPDYDAYKKAKELSAHQAATDAITGAVMGFVGIKNLSGAAAGTNTLLTKSVASALKQLGKAGVEKGLEGIAIGGVAGGGQAIKNILAQQQGISVSTDEGVADQSKMGFILTVGSAMVGKFANLLKPSTYNKILHGLSKMPEEVLNQEFNHLQDVGVISPEELRSAQNAIRQQKEINASIPESVPETERLKIQAKIKERDILEGQLEKVDPAFHPELKERIKILNEEIVNISKGNDRGELQKLIDKEIKDGRIKGFAVDVLKNATEKELGTHMKDIAEQAHDPATAQATIDAFGEEIVNKAKELYPKEIESSETGAGKVPSEQIGHIVVSEHGEDTKTAARQENGIEPSKLSEQGIREAKELGKYIVDNNKNKIVTSEVERAKQTANEAAVEAKSISGKEIPVESTPILNTWDIGEFDGKPEGSFNESEWAQKHNELVPGGESFNDFTKRMEQANEYIKSLPEDTHVVTHSKVMRALEALKQTDGKWTDETTNIFLNNKELTHAKDVRGNQGLIPKGGEIGGGSQDTGSNDIQQVPPNTSERGETEQQAGRREETGQGSSEEKVGEPPMAGITHRQMDAMAEEFGLPTYEKSPEKVAEWDEQATKQLQKPGALDELFTKLRNGITPDHVETRMMLQYMGDLLAKIDKDPYNRQLQDQLIRTKDLFNVAGRIQGKALVARKGSVPVEETLGDFLMRDRESNKAQLTDEQIRVSKKEYEEIKAAKEAYEKKLAEQKEKSNQEKAQKIVEQKAKEAKKQIGKDYKSERQEILKNIVEKWKKSSKENLGASILPYAKELAAISPDVMKLVKNLVEEGVTKLPDVIKAVHNQVKDIIPKITENDVHDIIAGEYNKKQTRNQITQQLYDLRREAKLMNELDQLLNGQVPSNPKKVRARNQRIEELKKQIKGLEDEMGISDEKRLEALKGRYKSQIADLENKIAKGDYGPDEKPEPIKLDQEAIELKDKMIKLKLDREARLAKQEYENRSKLQKAKDLASESLDVVRTLQTNPDMSFFGRQGIKFMVTHPIKGAKLFWESAKQAFSQARYDRWLYDLHNSPAWKLIEDSGLAVLDPNTLHASMREEQWRSQLIHKIPVAGQVAKASERAFTSAANMARVDWFMEGVDILRKQGKTFENAADEYKGWASAVNNMTGRGGLGAFEPVAGQLAIPFWSPRLIASNINLLNPYYYYKLPKTARIMALKNMAQYTITGVAFLAMAHRLGAEVESDPRSSDFGKLKVGNSRYDIWGGGAQYIRAFAQILTATRKTNGGMQKLDTKNQEVVGANLVRSKLSPLVGFGVDVTLGKNIVGEEVKLKDAWKLTVPMLWNDINDARKDSGADGAAVAGVLSFLGIGAQTYTPKSGGSGGGAGATGKFSKTTKLGKQTKTTKH